MTGILIKRGNLEPGTRDACAEERPGEAVARRQPFAGQGERSQKKNYSCHHPHFGLLFYLSPSAWYFVMTALSNLQDSVEET